MYYFGYFYGWVFAHCVLLQYMPRFSVKVSKTGSHLADIMVVKGPPKWGKVVDGKDCSQVFCKLIVIFFPQEEHWKIEPISKEEREAEQAKEAEQVCWNTFNSVLCSGSYIRQVKLDFVNFFKQLLYIATHFQIGASKIDATQRVYLAKSCTKICMYSSVIKSGVVLWWIRGDYCLHTTKLTSVLINSGC